jgi:arsenate reductase-like glutaredoxin family protein
MIQVFGTKRCRGTQKALRFFKERAVAVQFRDMDEKAPSPGELDDIAQAAGGHAALMDCEGGAAAKKWLSYMEYDPREELLRDPSLLRTPIVRAGKGKSAVGLDEKSWIAFAAAEKQ